MDKQYGSHISHNFVLTSGLSHQAMGGVTSCLGGSIEPPDLIFFLIYIYFISIIYA